MTTAIIENMNLAELMSVMYYVDSGSQVPLAYFPFISEGETFDLYLGESPKKIKALVIEYGHEDAYSNCYTVFEVEGQHYIVNYHYESYEGVRVSGKEIVAPAACHQKTEWFRA